MADRLDLTRVLSEMERLDVFDVGVNLLEDPEKVDFKLEYGIGIVANIKPGTLSVFHLEGTRVAREFQSLDYFVQCGFHNRANGLHLFLGTAGTECTVVLKDEWDRDKVVAAMIAVVLSELEPDEQCYAHGATKDWEKHGCRKKRVKKDQGILERALKKKAASIPGPARVSVCGWMADFQASIHRYVDKYLGIDVENAKEEVLRQLSVLKGKMTEDEWVTLYREALVGEVMES